MNWSDFLCSLVSIQKDELKKYACINLKLFDSYLKQCCVKKKHIKIVRIALAGENGYMWPLSLNAGERGDASGNMEHAIDATHCWNETKRR